MTFLENASIPVATRFSIAVTRMAKGIQDAASSPKRDGVRLVDFARAMTSAGILGLPGGRVECDALELDADGRALVVDDMLHELAAWLFDAAARRGEAADGVPIWPETLDTVRTSAGDALPVAKLGELGELLYTWPHRLPAPSGVSRSRSPRPS